MIKKTCTCLYVYLICLSAITFAQDQQRTDSMLKALHESRDDSVQFALLIDLHNAYFKSNPEESRNYALKMITLGEQTHNLFREYKGYLALNRCEDKFRNYDNIIPNAKKLLRLAIALGNTDEIFERTLGLAHNYIDGEYNDLVVPQLEEAMKIALSNGNDLQVNKVNYALGFFYHQTGESGKAILFLEKAIRKFKEVNDEKSLANAIGLYAESSLAVKADPGILNLLIAAEKLHEKNNSLYRRAYIRGLMAKYFVLNGNSAAAVENYQFAREMFLMDHNVVDYALAGLDLSGELLTQKQFSRAKTILLESEAIINEKHYSPGKIQVEIARINYLLSTDQPRQAKAHLDRLFQMADSSKATDVMLACKQLTAVYRQKSGKASAGNKAYFDYFKNLFRLREKQQLITELKLMERKYTGIDSSVRLIRQAASTAEGYDKLRQYFADNGYNGVILPDSFYIFPESFVAPDPDTSLNHILSMSYDAQLDAVDAVLNKKLVQNRLSEQKDRLRKNLLWAGMITGLLLLVIIALIVYSRRLKRKKQQSDKDKKTIENLHRQFNHLMVNNLQSVSNYIDLTMSKPDMDDEIQSLKIRVDVVRNFYETYKQQKIGEQLEKGGMVHLQNHIEDLGLYLKAINNFDDDLLKIDVNARVTVNYDSGLNLILLLSELIQNSCKYAFSHRDVDRENRIGIHISMDEKDILRMAYQDNGNGIPDDAAESLGSKIIREIAGTLTADINRFNDHGYHFNLTLKLKKDEYKKVES